MSDDRILCRDCANFDARCTIATERNLPGAWMHFTTLVELPQRCIFFVPLRSAVDQRTGAQRWPEFAEHYRTVKRELRRVEHETAQRGITRAKAAIGQRELVDTS